MNLNVFHLIRLSFEMLGINTDANTLNLRNAIILICLGQCTISTTAYFLFEAKHISEYAESFYIQTTAALVFFAFVILIWKSPSIFQLIDDFERTIEERLKDPMVMDIYIEVIQKITKITRIINFGLGKLTLACVMSPSLIMSLYIYLTMDSKCGAFRLPFPIWLPFNWRTPFGYLVAFSLQFVSIICIAQTCACNLILLFGSCEMIISFIVDIKEQLNSFSGIIQYEEMRTKLKHKLSKFIQFHSSAKEFVGKVSKVCEFIFTATFLWSILTICSTLLMVQMEISQNSGNPMDSIRPLALIFWTFVSIFLTCDFGEKVSNQFDDIDDVICQLKWYELPIEMQRILPMIMMSTQQPEILQGFGNIQLQRETFKKVVNVGFSFFTVFRQFEI